MAIAAFHCLAACNAEPLPPLTVSNLDITAPRPSTKMSAGYMVLTNNTDTAVEITSVSSPQFERVETHETIIENDIARMRSLDALRIEPRDQIVLERGGKHLMLMHPTGTLETVTINLHSGDSLLLSISAIPRE